MASWRSESRRQTRRSAIIRAVDRAPSLALVLVLLAGTLGVGMAIKQPCVTGPWDGRQYTHLCYTDLIPLYGTEHLQGNRLPYLDACPASDGQCDEYPVLTMYAMRGAAWLAPGTTTGFYLANVALLILCAIVVALCLFYAGGYRAIYFVAAPTLAIYAFVNWDLIAVAFATAATVAYQRKRDGWSGVLLGLGTAAKLYPVLLAVPFVLGRLREGRRREAVRLAVGAAVAWLVVNLPFAALAPKSWLVFFRFNSARLPDWDSLWFIGCQTHSTGAQACLPGSVSIVNAVSAIGFVVLSVIVWRIKKRRHPHFERWTFGLPMLILFLLSNKVYSPQYSLWLLPWFALALPDWRLFAAFEAADVAVFVTRFLFFAHLTSDAGLPFWPFEVALLARAVVLVVCVSAWVLRRAESVAEPAPL